MKTTTLQSRNLLNRSTRLCAWLLVPVALVCRGLSPQAGATCQHACLGSNTVQGDDALINLTTGTDNTAIGFNALFGNTEGDHNTAIGSQALYSNVGGAFGGGGNDNTAIGYLSLYANTTGGGNTAVGLQALQSNTSGFYNTALGRNVLFNNTSGEFNTACGIQALWGNTTGVENTAIGDDALYSNTTGASNTASGALALFSNTTGNLNAAAGYSALSNNTTGNENTANGYNALILNTTGNDNTAIGVFALLNNRTASGNTAVGVNTLFYNRRGSNNTAIGNSAGSSITGDNNIDIGNVGVRDESKTIRIGTKQIHSSAFIAGINGATVPTGVAVIVDADGHLGTTTSSARFKEAIKPMDKASEAILALKPVTFRYKHELDPDGVPQFGLVAEDVQKVDPDPVARDEQGKPYTVRYDAVNAMLLNEFIKEHRKNEEQGATIARLEKQVEALTAGLQKVSAQLEVSKAANGFE